MSIIESLKEEKKLSLSHWRYRLLHWCFNVTVDEYTTRGNDLPVCLYTHYCPLFHLTNLIAIFSPMILTVKVIIAVASAFIYAFGQIKWSWPTKEVVVDPPSLEELRQMEYKEILKYLKHPGWWIGFDHFWESKKSIFMNLTQEEVESKYNELVTKYKGAAARAEERRKKFRDRLIFWVNFSRVLVKWTMNISYFAITGVVLYGIYHMIGPMIGFVNWLLTFNPIPMMLFVGKIALIIGGIFGAIYFLLRFKVFQTCATTSLKAGAYAMPPVVLVSQVTAAPFKWIGKGIVELCEFISVFYEENCPPITIISEEEEKIEEATNV